MSEQKTYICDACKNILRRGETLHSKVKGIDQNGVDIRLSTIPPLGTDAPPADLCTDCWISALQLLVDSMKELKECNYP